MRPQKNANILWFTYSNFETFFILRLLWRQKVNKLNLNKSEIFNMINFHDV